jgi:photosystem II PsbM protein
LLTENNQQINMQRVAFLCIAFLAAAQAFAPSAPLALRNANAGVCAGNKLAASCRVARPTSVAPKMSLETAGTQLLLAGEGMAVSSAAYLAVLFGTFIPVVFLLTLFIQSEARKAAESGSEGNKF